MKLFGLAGYSGSGKTTLIEQLMPRLIARGLRVSLIKHAHHAFDIDQRGKDSYRHRQAGASEVMIASDQRWVLMHELRNERELSLSELVSRFSPCDLVLVEGYKREPIAKLEVHRRANGKPLLYPDDPNILAIASDERLDSALPWYDLNQIAPIADFVFEFATRHPTEIGRNP